MNVHIVMIGRDIMGVYPENEYSKAEAYHDDLKKVAASNRYNPPGPNTDYRVHIETVIIGERQPGHDTVVPCWYVEISVGGVHVQYVERVRFAFAATVKEY